jgi:hypothetical protein
MLIEAAGAIIIDAGRKLLGKAAEDGAKKGATSAFSLLKKAVTPTEPVLFEDPLVRTAFMGVLQVNTLSGQTLGTFAQFSLKPAEAKVGEEPSAKRRTLNISSAQATYLRTTLPDAEPQRGVHDLSYLHFIGMLNRVDQFLADPNSPRAVFTPATPQDEVNMQKRAAIWQSPRYGNAAFMAATSAATPHPAVQRQRADAERQEQKFRSLGPDRALFLPTGIVNSETLFDKFTRRAGALFGKEGLTDHQALAKAAVRMEDGIAKVAVKLTPAKKSDPTSVLLTGEHIERQLNYFRGLTDAGTKLTAEETKAYVTCSLAAGLLTTHQNMRLKVMTLKNPVTSTAQRLKPGAP